MSIDKERSAPDFRRLLLAILIPVVTVIASHVTLDKMTSYQAFSGNWVGLTLHLVIAAGPFVALAFFGPQKLPAWVTTILLTVLAWSIFTADAISMRGKGANQGLMAVMFLSPLWIYLSSILVSKLLIKSQNV